jgi:hypothetical protein
MSALSSRSRGIVAVALVVPFAAALWAVRDPSLMSGSALAVLGIVVMALGTVALMAWRGGQATTTTSQIIHDADVTNIGHQRPPRR